MENTADDPAVLFVTCLHRGEKLVDVAGLEPATPCLQTRQGKTLTALSGVAYTENQRNFRSLKCPEVVPNSPATNPLQQPRRKMAQAPLRSLAARHRKKARRHNRVRRPVPGQRDSATSPRQGPMTTLGITLRTRKSDMSGNA